MRVAVLNISDVDYHCIINRISKSEAVNLIVKVYKLLVSNKILSDKKTINT